MKHFGGVKGLKELMDIIPTSNQPSSFDELIDLVRSRLLPVLWSQHSAACVRRPGLVAVRRGVGCCRNMERQLWCESERHRARRWRHCPRPEALISEHLYDPEHSPDFLGQTGLMWGLD